MKSYAVLVVDMLKGFFGADDIPAGDIPEPGRTKVIEHNVRLLEAARRLDVPIVYVCDRHAEAERKIDTEFRHFVPHCIAGTPGAEVLDEIRPEASDLFVEKKRFDGFFSSALDLILRELDAETLIVTGVHTDVCVQHTAMGAFFRGYKVVIPTECCASPEESNHERGLQYMERWYKAEIAATNEVMEMLEESLVKPVST